MVPRAEGTRNRWSIRDEAKLDQEGSSDDEGRLNGEGDDENETTTRRCWVRVKPAWDAVHRAEEESPCAEGEDGRDRLEIRIWMNIERLTGKAECCKYGVAWYAR